MLKIAIVIGSTRPQRVGGKVGRWVYEQAQTRGDAEFELIDLREINLPLLDEPSPAASGNYQHQHTKQWSEKVSGFDGFIFVTPEYNHGIPASLKNALDFLYHEWNNKVCGFVGYGNVMGARAIESLRRVCCELQLAPVNTQLGFNLMTDFKDYQELTPAPYHQKKLHQVLDQVMLWGETFSEIRNKDQLTRESQSRAKSENEISLQ